jgi:hypothetical protein
MGIFHTYKQHDKIAFVTSFFPPVGIYFGAEKYWHKKKDKFATIDWNKRMKGDVYILYKLLASVPKNDEMSSFNESLEKFSSKIMDYPKERVDYLKEAAKKYARFLQAVNTDFNQYFDKFFKNNNAINQEWSSHCKPILDSIVNEYEINELSITYAEIDSSFQIMTNQKNSGVELDIEPDIYIEGMKKLITTDMLRINRIYKMIFNEEIGINITEQSLAKL